MLKAVEPFIGLLITVVIALVLIIFRKEVPKLVNWIVSFRRIAKTKDGYELEGSHAPEPVPRIQSEQREQAIVAAEIITEKQFTTETQRVATETEPALGTRAVAAETWIDALISKRYEESIALLQKELDSTADADNQLALKGAIGNVKFEQNAAAGIEYFESLVRQNPKKHQPYHWYALSFLWKDLPEKAESILRIGLQSADRKAHLYDTLSDCLKRLGRTNEALQAAADGVSDDPTFIANYLNAARILTESGDSDEARRWYLRALDASNGAEDVLASYARFLSSTDRKAETILRCQELVSRDSTNVVYLGLLGNAYLAEELNSMALSCYLRARELTGGSASWIEANIGNMFKNRGFYGEAIKYLKAAVSLDPNSQYAHERLAQAQKLDSDEREKLAAVLKSARVKELASLQLSEPRS